MKKIVNMRIFALLLLLALLMTFLLTIPVGVQAENIPTWQVGYTYYQGNLATYNGSTYICTMQHTSQIGWEPDKTLTLWQKQATTSTPIPISTSTPTLIPTTGFSLNGYILPDFLFSESSVPELMSGFKVELIENGLNALSDSKGYFEITGITGGTYTVRISKDNYLYRNIANVSFIENVELGSTNQPVDIWAGDMLRDGMQDNAINMNDVMGLIKYYNTTSSDSMYNADADLNKDSAVNMTDIMIIVKHFNKTISDYPEFPILTQTATPTPTVTITVTVTPTSTYTPTPTYAISTPPYEPEKWNDGSSIQFSTNCYAYGLNLQKNPLTGASFPIPGFSNYCLQPGELAGRKDYLNVNFVKDPQVIINSCTKDASAINGVFTSISADALCPQGTYKVALVLDIGNDYHWYRQNPDGSWSHKPGTGRVTDVDASNKKIYNPELADRNYNELNYSTFVGYFAVKAILAGGPRSDILSSNISDYSSGNSTINRGFNVTASQQISLSIVSFDFLKLGIKVEDVRNIVGLPNEYVGSGIIMDSYYLNDGSKIILNYGAQRDGLTKAMLIHTDKTREVLIQ